MGRKTLPEPPDDSRLEFEADTVVYAAWRDDASSEAAGWPSGDGGMVWCLYGSTVPKTWNELVKEFGRESLKNAVLLVPASKKEARKRLKWPTYAGIKRRSR